MSPRAARDPSGRGSRLRRVAIGALVLVASVAAASTWLDAPQVRRFVARSVNAALKDVFEGRLTIDAIGSLSLSRVAGVEAHAVAPDGTEVLVVHGASARIHAAAFLLSLVRGGDLKIEIYDGEVEAADIDLDAEAGGRPKLASAFTLAHPGSAGGPAWLGRPIRLRLLGTHVRHSTVHHPLAAWPGLLPDVEGDFDDVHATAHVGFQDLGVDVARAVTTLRGVPHLADAHGVAQAHLVVPGRTGCSFALTASFRGEMGAVPAQANWTLDTDFVDATFDVPRAEPEAARRTLDGWTPVEPVSLHAEAHGPWGAIRTTAHATVGAHPLDVAGQMSLRGPFAGTLHVEARHTDLRVLAGGGPRSDVDLHVGIVGSHRPAGVFAGSFAVQASPGTLEGRPTPGAAWTGDFERNAESGRFDVAVRGRIDEPGAPVLMRAESTSVPSPAVTFSLESQVERIDRVGGLGAAFAGSADVRVEGRLDLGPAPTVDLRAKGTLSRLRGFGSSAERLRFAGKAWGAITNPRVAARIEADDVRLGPYGFSRAHLETFGRLERQSVDVALDGGGLGARAHATIRPGAATTVDDAAMALWRGARRVNVRIERLRFERRRLDVEGASLDGAGEPLRAALHVRPGWLALQAQSTGLSLEALGGLLGAESQLRRGRLALDVNLRARETGAEGAATIDLADASLLRAEGVSAHLCAKMSGRAITGRVGAKAGGLGALEASGVSVHVDGGLLDPASWRRAWGTVDLDGELDLARLAAVLPADRLPVGELAGRVVVHGHAARRTASDAAPDIALSVRTSGLKLAGRGGPDRRSDGVILVASAPWSLSGVDLALDAHVAGDGLTEVAVRVDDAAGPIAALDAKSTGAWYGRWLASGGDLVAALRDVPVRAVFSVPQRRLESLPNVLRPPGVAGAGQVTASFDGTMVEPVVKLHGSARALRFVDAPGADPIDADLALAYDGRAADLQAELRSRGATLARAAAELRARAGDWLAGRFAWDASVRATLSDLPLGVLPVLPSGGLHGKVSGRLDLTDLHADARLDADFRFAGLRSARGFFDRAHARATFDGRSLAVDASFDEGDGSAHLTGAAGLAWGDRVIPAWDASRPAAVSLKARRFRVAVLAPLVESEIEGLEGRLDADASFSLSPDGDAALRGSATLDDGQLGVVGLGQDLHAVAGKVTFEPGGVVRLTDASARGTSGKVGATAVAHLRGVRLLDARAELTISKKDAMPLAIEGTEVGTAYGRVSVTTQPPGAGARSVRVDVPSWHVELPVAASHGVEELRPPPTDVHVGVYTAKGRFRELAVDGSGAAKESATRAAGEPPIVATIHLGNDVEVRRGTDVKVFLEGDVTARLANKPTMRGQLRIRSGVLAIDGNAFEIQSGTLTFDGTPDNPMVKLAAAWPAADGTRIIAEYLGPLKSGKVTLRSEPPRSQNEILALIVFGTANGSGSASTPYASPQPAATRTGTTVGGLATGELSRGLERLTGLDLTARVDYSQVSPRPEVEVQIARDISLELGFVLGTPPPGTNPDTTYATIDWRFLRSWSLATTFGNLGSSIADVVWQHRY